MGTMLALGSGLAFAQQDAGPGKRGGMMRKMGRALNLTDAQREQIRAIMKQTAEANADVREQLKSLRDKEKEAIKAEASESDLRNLAQSAAPLMAQLHGSRLVAQAKIYALLTPEQRQKMDRMRERGRGRWQRRQDQ
jgi:Spy/CpxP family protein refolding chaperone